jgi:hypothetical protein
MIDIIDATYLGACGVTAIASLSSRVRAECIGWVALSVALLCLGILRIEKAGLLIDPYLQQGLHHLGWYGHRRTLQVLCVAGFAMAVWALFRKLPPSKVPSFSCALFSFYELLLFVAIRLSSLHWTDILLSEPLSSTTVGRSIQVALLAAISVGACIHLTDAFAAKKCV